MRKIRLASLLLSIAALLAIPILLASCGGGGGGGNGITYINSKATGTYQYVMLANGFSIETGTAFFDGAGNGTYTAIQTSGTETSGTLSYSVTADNTMTLDGTMVGTMRSGGNFFVLNHTVNTEEAMLIAVKLSSGMTDTANTYVGGQFSFDTVTPISSADILQIETHTPLVSTLTYSSLFTSDTGTIDYTFNLDGSFSMPMVSATMYGAITNDYDLMILGDGDNSDNDLTAICMLKSATTATLSTLNGTYIMHEFMDDDVSGGGAFITSRARVIFNGDGTGSYTELANSTGTVAPGTDPFTYSVNTDGTFLVSAGSDTLYGSVLQDGSVFGLIDPDPSDNKVAVAIGVKK